MGIWRLCFARPYVNSLDWVHTERKEGVMGWFSKLLGGGSGVRFVKRYSEKRQLPTGAATYHYEIYRGNTAEEARQFLAGKSLKARNTYVVVETPEGNWGRDVAGVYKERG